MAGEWRLSAVEFDVLWRELGFGEPPYPLELPSPGETDDERARIVSETLDDLAARRLVDRELADREAGLLAALVLLGTSQVVIDAHLVLADHVRLVAARTGDRAALVLQLRERLIVRAIPGPRLDEALTELLPAVPAAHGQSVTVPHAVLTAALSQLGEGGGAWDFEQALRDAGVRGQDVRWIAGLIWAERGDGAQFGATARWPGGGEQRLGYLSWFATGDGGVVIHRQGDGQWVTLAPGDPSRLVARLLDMARAPGGTA